VLAYDYPILGLFWTFLWIFLWVAWLFILFKVVFDIFRSHDLGGWGKALWVIFVILIPWLGVLVYLIARGQGMGERDMQEAQASKQAFDSYVRQTAGSSTSTADELSKLADLQARGLISQTEFEQQKAKILG
jgi:Short C-terminal domain